MDDNLANDLLRGAKQIAMFYFGDAKHARKVFHLVDTGRLPVFREGATICARKSRLREWVQEQEQAAVASRAA